MTMCFSEFASTVYNVLDAMFDVMDAAVSPVFNCNCVS